MQKNVAGQKWVVYAFDRTTLQPKTGDAANITAKIGINGAAPGAVTDENPTEREDGKYVFDISQGESNGNLLTFYPESSTANIIVYAEPGSLYTTAPNSNKLGIESDGDLTKCNLVNTTTTLTNKTGFILSATGLDAISQAATGMIEIAKAVWDRVLSGATHNIATSAGKRVRQIAGISYSDGTAQAGSLNTITLGAGESATDDIFWQSYVAIVDGTGAGQGHHIISYNGTTKVAVIDDNWITQPDNTSEYVIYGAGSHDEFMSGLAQTGTASTITLESTADAYNDLIKDAFIVIVSGTGSHQTRQVTDYDGTTKVATVTPDWVTNPDSTSGYWIAAQGQPNVFDELLSGSTHNIANSLGRRIRNLQEYGTYEGGAIFFDTIDGTAGTTDHENGTNIRPVDNIADANTLAASLNIHRFRIVPGSSITFAAAQNNQVFKGTGWTLALGSQSIVGITIEGAIVSGIASGIGTTQVFKSCIIGNISMIKNSHFRTCGLAGKITIVEAGNIFFDRCHDDTANGTDVVINVGDAIGNSYINFRGYFGTIEVENMGQAGIDILEIEGTGHLNINANCIGGTVRISGNMTYTNNGSGMTINDNARIDTEQVNTEVDNALDTAIPDSPTANSMNDVLNRQEELIVAGTAQTGTLSTTQMSTDLPVTVNDQLNDRILTFKNNTTTVQLRGQQVDIDDIDSDGLITFGAALTTAPVNGDKFEVT